MADMLESSLLDLLEQQSERVTKPASTVLFGRGDSAKGMFVILSGKVKVDTGVDSAHCRSCSPRDVVGLYSALTGREYAMTATVTEDAELGFWSLEALDSLLRKRSDFCRPLLAILGVRIAEGDDLASPREVIHELPAARCSRVGQSKPGSWGAILSLCARFDRFLHDS